MPIPAAGDRVLFGQTTQFHSQVDEGNNFVSNELLHPHLASPDYQWTSEARLPLHLNIEAVVRARDVV